MDYRVHYFLLDKIRYITVHYFCSGSREALWFSTKFEKKMAAMEDETPSSPLTRFQREVPLRQSKVNSGSLFCLIN